ncbi:Pr6Pr family membrane protein [Mycobacterium sp. 21AC1]|uniref:Pr6Pr family membrane protein n=1 Tax=[Mycobacterium] appelbergii TaxID=2939269 RepID=UPI002938CF99|nr:Pr6Pr family membrane protein [Mycobacterium sp. 21AC1]MDV3126356.1 Pr6Pr family membrane protein [Mycobacterium sp. 21AC1]
MGAAAVRVALRVAIVAAVVLALVLVEVSTRSGVLWRLITFTYQANLLAAAFYAWTLASPRADARAGLRGAVVVYVLVAGVVWNLLLTDMSMGYTGANILLHVVVPLLAAAEWLLVSSAQRGIRWWQPLVWLTYPAAYIGLALLVLTTGRRRVPYYFLDPGTVGSWVVAANVGLLATVFVGLGYGLMAVARSPVFARNDAG